MSTPAEELFLAMLNSGQLDRPRVIALMERGRGPGAPTHAEFIEHVLAVAPPASKRTYKTGFNRLVAAFAAKSIADVQASDLDSICAELFAATRRAGSNDGTGAVRGFTSAARFWYGQAVRLGHRPDNPAQLLTMPARRRRVRRALTESELCEVYHVVASGGNDPVLDTLLLDFHRETAARMGGALHLRTSDLNLARGSVLLREKYGHEREVPASRELLYRIAEHTASRSTPHPEAEAFRYRNGSVLTRRRYNSIFKRVQTQLPWAGRLGVSVHWLRHTTLTDISNATGSRVAAAYAGHTERNVTDIYTVPTFEDLQAAHMIVFSSPT